MFERFTDRARRVVVLAQEEARLLGHNYIGTEHILLGLIHEEEGVAAKALLQLGISLDAVRAKVEAIIGEGGKTPTGHIPFTPRAKKVLELSLREALQLGHNYIGTEHILLGLIREGQGVAAQVLMTMGADLSVVRETVLQQLGGFTARRMRTGPVAFSRPPETPAAAQAGMEARRLAGGGPVGSQHDLLGLLGVEQSMAAKALEALGITRERLEATLSELEPAGTADETPEQAGARRIGLRVEGKLIMLEIDDPELAESLENAMAGRKVRVIRGSDPEAEEAGFPNLWSAASRTIDDLTRRLTRMTSRGGEAAPAPPGWNPATLGAGYIVVNTKSGPVGHLEVGSGIDRAAARAWLRDWLQQHRAQLLGPPVEDATRYCALWANLSRSGQPFGMQNVGFETEGAGCEPVTLDVLIDAAIADLS